MRRIQRDVCHEDLVKRLTVEDGAVFGEIWRLLLFAAAVGRRSGTRRPLNKVDSGKAMPESYFGTPGWKGLLYLLGVSETGVSDCLRSDAQQSDFLVTLFEEYANAGLFILQERLQVSINPQQEILNLMAECRQKESARPDIDDLI
ncbi:dnd system-associated protein 4 [Thioflavicoccus mobilis 8321]|uniref:Dnd system-associated protein 4 n=1 Tax=Thioflavicoccus mobilis 8321 TaxID=765912 RepID=L0H036_9GAMM|nr:DNA phosphorothioation-associated protein 4 [Thioflavicoccus mobilis]AGA91427.1 dnd system-associated protein 4 [Thioflavicoccus mobilis 8321]